METAPDPINVSALNQYAYCPRRCGLIYLEGEFANNLHTQRGNAEHERVDRAAHATTRDGARVEYALPIWSDRLGLIGKCDVVEFWPDGVVYPVEYKHGPRRAWLNDDLQLAAQALCLEEMLTTTITRGAIFHAGSKRRREINITDALRDDVASAVSAIQEMLANQRLPDPTADTRRCRECSMKDICQPEAARALRSGTAGLGSLFEPDAT
jgi:CRISPR-associated exonuclease Cas4